MKIVFTNDPSSNLAERIKERRYIPDDAEVIIVDYLPNESNEEFYKALEEADVVIDSYVYLGKKEIDAMKKCRCISFRSTGFNEVDLEYATSKGIPVASILDYCTQETAENAVALMLSLQRGTHIYNKAIQEKGEWDVSIVPHQQRVEGQTIGIVGLGRIGRHVARITGKGIGMRVIAYDPFIPESIAEEAGAKLVDFDTLLAESDVISIHMALTDSNAHMFNKEVFRKMKRKPIIINEGRGSMIVEEDLAWALDEGIVRSAGLDMLDTEVPDKEYLKNCPLLGRENVILNPHSGFQSDTARDLIDRISVENAINAYEGNYDKVWVIRNGVGLS